MQIVELSTGWTVVLDCVVWAVTGTLTGYLCHRAAPPRFTTDSWLTRLRPWERDGRVYERRLRIKSWKSRLPEAGHVFGDGYDKRHLDQGDGAHLARFATETRRAEVTHWAAMAWAPLFVLWNPWGLFAVMVAYAIVANLPCIAIQRYNRARLERVLGRVGRRRAR